ncbi:DUF1254 domain-containing protein [Luteimonas aestuarii]|uniref:DUF1254 domain-containing protein n=1 Tax=Luteimonas aestuarii TaxID=453837 RepID=A0A4R5TYN4_9GAMM|nr:DUF1254 domain-containing protein [Luteimonas aestuarii]TDK26323.1 DUF1254 domain-containing protein [Luteimonas aestuarii]
MKRMLACAMLALATGVATHFAWVSAMPHRLMGGAMDTLGRDGERLHQWIHARRASPASRAIVRPSPDLAYSVCVFDLSRGDVRVRVHPSAGYWSLSLYTANSDNVRTWNDTGAPGGVEVVLTHGDAMAGDGRVALRSQRGIAAVRRLAPTPAEWEAAEAIRERDLCEVQP